MKSCRLQIETRTQLKSSKVYAITLKRTTFSYPLFTHLKLHNLNSEKGDSCIFDYVIQYICLLLTEMNFKFYLRLSNQ